MKDESSEDFQYLDDDDFCITDIENKKIDKLTKQMNIVKDLLYNFDDNKLNELDKIKRDFYFLCDNNRYLIDDSIFLQKLEIYIYDNIAIYEDKLFKMYEELVDKEDKAISEKNNPKVYYKNDFHDKPTQDDYCVKNIKGEEIEEPIFVCSMKLKEPNLNRLVKLNEITDDHIPYDDIEFKNFYELTDTNNFNKSKEINLTEDNDFNKSKEIIFNEDNDYKDESKEISDPSAESKNICILKR